MLVLNLAVSKMSPDNQEISDAPWSYVKFDTSIGSFVVELYHRHTPRTCYNIAALAHAGYYDGESFLIEIIAVA